jgi:hypothetical protein
MRGFKDQGGWLVDARAGSNVPGGSILVTNNKYAYYVWELLAFMLPSIYLSFFTFPLLDPATSTWY